MELPLTVQLSKLEIARLYRSGRIGEDSQNRLDKIVQGIYDDGREMGLAEALNYVVNEEDRERLFNAIAELEESRNNEC